MDQPDHVTSFLKNRILFSVLFFSIKIINSHIFQKKFDLKFVNFFLVNIFVSYGFFKRFSELV